MTTFCPARLALLVAYALTALLVGAYFATSEKIAKGDGFGADGVRYGQAAIALAQAEFRPDTYVVQRILPSAVAHYALRAFGLPLDPPSVIVAFEVLNWMSILLMLWLWHLIARDFRLSPKLEFIGLIGLVWTFASIKWPAYYPVLTDTTAAALGMAMVFVYLRGYRLTLVALTLASAFVWPSGPLVGAILVAWPRRPLAADLSDGRRLSPTFTLAIAAILSAALTLLALLQNGQQIAPYLDWSGTQSAPLLVVSATLLFAFLYMAVGAILMAQRDLLGGPIEAIKALDWRMALLVLGGLGAVKFFQGTWAVPTKGGEVGSLWHALQLFAALGVQLPGKFLVAHVVYLGPTIGLALLMWPRIARCSAEIGWGASSVLLFAVLFSINSESRHLILLYPMVVVLVALALNTAKLDIKTSFVFLFAITSLWFAKPWLVIGKLASGNPEAWPNFLFYMHLGPWMPYVLYLQQVGLVFLLLWSLASILPGLCHPPARFRWLSRMDRADNHDDV